MVSWCKIGIFVIFCSAVLIMNSLFTDLNLTAFEACKADATPDGINDLLSQIDKITTQLLPQNVVKDILEFLTSQHNSLLVGEASQEERVSSFNALLRASEKVVSTLVMKTETNYSVSFSLQTIAIQVFVVGPNCTLENIPLLNTADAQMDIDLIGVSKNDMNRGHAAVSFMSYANMFNASFFSTTADSPSLMMSSVVSATLPKTTNTSLTEPINFTLKHSGHIAELDPEGRLSCMNWKDIKWVADVCSIISTNSTHTVCSCHHPGTFALIMQIKCSSKVPQDYLYTLNVVAMAVGLGFLVLTLLTFALCRQHLKVNSVAQVNLTLSLLLAHLLFLLTQKFLQKIRESLMICTVLAGVLHFLFLSAFVWMLIDAVLLFISAKNLMKIQSSKKEDILGWRCLIVIGYVIPLLLVGVSAGLVPDGYGTEQCWIKMNNGFLWSFLGPVCFILASNLILFGAILIMVTFTLRSLNNEILLRTNTQILADKKVIKSVMFKTGVQFFILGCPWILGFFTCNSEVLEILFLVFNSQQGTFIFLIHCVLNKEVREQCRKWSSAFFSSKKPLHSPPTMMQIQDRPDQVMSKDVVAEYLKEEMNCVRVLEHGSPQKMLFHGNLILKSTKKLVSGLVPSDYADIINVVAMAVGLGFLVLTLLTFALCRQHLKVNSVAQVNLTLSLLLAHLLFLLTHCLSVSLFQMICTVLAGVLHFLFLSAFVWMLIDAVLLFISAKNLTKIQSSKKEVLGWRCLIVIGYVIPLLLVGVSAGLVPHGYGSEQCWIKMDKGFLWSFLGPVSFILASNLILYGAILIMVIFTLKSLNNEILQRKNTLADRKLIKSVMFKTGVQFFILGCPWILGFFTCNSDVLEILFLVFNSQQGTFIFLIHCVLNKEMSSFNPIVPDPTNEPALATAAMSITPVGLVFLGLTLLTFVLYRRQLNVKNVALVNLCISLLLTYIFVFIKAGLKPCQVLGGFLHFFFLSAFVWMLIDAVLLFISAKNLAKLRSRQASAFGWKCLIVTGYVPPLIVVNMILFIAIFIIIALTLKKLNQQASQRQASRRQASQRSQTLAEKKVILSVLFKTIAQFVILGCPWMVSLIMNKKVEEYFSFVILISLQGIFIFLVHCVLDQESCQVLGGFLHFFFLSAFVWMLIDAVLLFNSAKNLAKLRSRQASAFGWKSLIVTGYVPPLIVVNIILFIAIFIIIAFTLKRLNQQASQRQASRRQASQRSQTLAEKKVILSVLFKTIAQFVILGCPWMVSLIMKEREKRKIVDDISFVFLISLQGIFIFLVHCVLDQEVSQPDEPPLSHTI
ncbi:uncharacterized protein [Salminus brasiliensis]|uniref:uncharacterized protein n=1 Tax=Salminus brasiliensis TaxID=930266 RepID=UPI003B82CE3A